MTASKRSISQILENITSERPHSDICKCNMCMKSRLPKDIVSQHEHELKATMVDRRNPDAPVRPLMKATTAHAIIKAGTSVDMMEATGLTIMDLPSTDSNVYLTAPKEITIDAKWRPSAVEKASSGSDASVFGSLGVLLVPPGFSYIDIPKMNARAVDPHFLKKYGAELIPLEQEVSLESVSDPSLENLYLVQYDFDRDYIEQYVMKMQGGGGLFVETHPFPHVFTPLSPDCNGALILGKDAGKGKYTFAAFEIPFGYTMKVDSNTIHGDSFFIGPYAIALTETELADSVLFRQETSTRDIQKITQSPTLKIFIPILAEYRLAKAINHQMMIEKLRSDHTAMQLDLDFFQKLPLDILQSVSDVLPLAQSAIEERSMRVEEIVETSSEYDSESIGSVSSEDIDIEKSPPVGNYGFFKKQAELDEVEPEKKPDKGIKS